MGYKKLVFSGVQPTGNLHLGNYLGALKNFVSLQKEMECIYCVVDLHAITTFQKPSELLNNVLDTTASFLATGLDPNKSIIFNQSSVSGHAELAWILNCVSRIGWLNRMTQFKDKAGKNKEKAPLGLYSYPVLMAADILLYKATHVPVGDDQKQHLELSRNIAQAFNRFYNTNFFPIPEPVIMGQGTRVMSLKDGQKKMSKSDPSELSRVNLMDSSEEISKKIQKAKTDSDPFPRDLESLDSRPEIKNLINILASISQQSNEEIINKYREKSFTVFKNVLSEVLNEEFTKISLEMRKLLKEQKYLEQVLFDGASQASEIATKNLKEIKELMGLI